MQYVAARGGRQVPRRSRDACRRGCSHEPRQAVAATSSPGLLDPDRLRALAATRSGEHGRAADHLRRVAQKRPDDPDAWLALGCSLLAADEPAEGAAALRRVLELEPERPGARLHLGRAFHHAGNLPAAAAAYRAALDEPAPGWGERLVDRVLSRRTDPAECSPRGRWCTRSGRAPLPARSVVAAELSSVLRGVLPALERQVRHDPDDRQAWVTLCATLAVERPAQAVNRCLAGLEHHPGAPGLDAGLAIARWRRDSRDRGRPDDAASRETLADHYARLSSALLPRDPFALAVPLLTETVALDPDHTGAHRHLALALARRDQVVGALPDAPARPAPGQRGVEGRADAEGEGARPIRHRP